jgi:hypothetical protein
LVRLRTRLSVVFWRGSRTLARRAVIRGGGVRGTSGSGVFPD